MSDPTGRQALFGPPTGAAAPSANGRHALFSAPPRGRGQVVVECGRCHGRTPQSLVQLVGRLVPSLWLPGLAFSRLMRCPACDTVAWCRVHWRTLLG